MTSEEIRKKILELIESTISFDADFSATGQLKLKPVVTGLRFDIRNEKPLSGENVLGFYLADKKQIIEIITSFVKDKDMAFMTNQVNEFIQDKGLDTNGLYLIPYLDVV